MQIKPGQLISPGTIIRIEERLDSWFAPEWFYAIYLHGRRFYVIATEQIITLTDSTLMRADIDNRLVIM